MWERFVVFKRGSIVDRNGKILVMLIIVEIVVVFLN